MPNAAIPTLAYGQIPIVKTNGRAIASLCLGFDAFCLGLTGIAAIAFGVQARGEIRRSDGTQKGDGLALARIILGVIGAVLNYGFVLMNWGQIWSR